MLIIWLRDFVRSHDKMSYWILRLAPEGYFNIKRSSYECRNFYCGILRFADICWCLHGLGCNLDNLYEFMILKPWLLFVHAIMTLALTLQSWPWHLLILSWPLLWPCSHDLALRLQEEENRAAREHQQRAAARQAQQPRPAAQPRKKSSDVSDVSACQVP